MVAKFRVLCVYSQLLSLKAELARKKNEASQTANAKFTGLINPNLNLTKSSSGKSKERKAKAEAKSTKSKSCNDEYEDTQLLQKSQRVLEAKAKFYDKMTASGGSLNSDDTCLVMFSEKKARDIGPAPIADLPPDDEPHRRRSSSSSSSSISSDSADDDDLPPDEQWVEYTDCVGRTRKCLRKDLEFFKKKDTELAREPEPTEEDAVDDRRSETPERERKPKVTGPSYSHPNVNFPLPTDRESQLAEMRKHWEEKEVLNANRDDIHYQDVLFDEARTHGVGYYQFAPDEKQRAKQMEQLQAERERTKEAQHQREIQIKNREKIIAERVLAAKNRQRARLGLPRLENCENEAEEKEKKASKDEEKRKRKEREKQDEQEAEERNNAKIRRQHLRPWDKGKSGRYDDSDSADEAEEWKYKPEREPMSQDQWVRVQRDVRHNEFAPPSATATQAAAHAAPYATPYSAPYAADNSAPTKPPMQRVRRNAEGFPPPTTATADGGVTGSGIYDYFNQYKIPQRKATSGGVELETSIEAGLRYLRNQSDKNATTTKYTWTQNADY